jgi:hypothetical protein
LLQLGIDNPLVNCVPRRYYPRRGILSSSPSAHAVASLRINFAAARERFQYFAFDLLGNVMDIDSTLAPSGAASAEPKRNWTSPVVLDLGSMRHLTLLQGDSNGGICTPPAECP